MTLLSRNGGSSGAMADSELALKAAAEAAGAEWSIVRVGLVKGGGPGNVARGDSIGLDEYFYNTNPEINSFQKDKFADQYLLGAKLKPGDTVANNPFQMIFASQATSVAAEGSVNRNIAARVLVQSLFQPGCANADFSVDSTRGLAVPTQESFDKAFSDCFQSGEGICEYKPEDIPEVLNHLLQACGSSNRKVRLARLCQVQLHLRHPVVSNSAPNTRGRACEETAHRPYHSCCHCCRNICSGKPTHFALMGQ